MKTKELFRFIVARHSIYEQRQAGLPKPWTHDPILQGYRFCNVYRELDTQTKWLRDNWEKFGGEDYWFACVVFRLTNWNETAGDLGYPVPWNKKKFITVLAARKKHGLKVYSGAYTISTNGVAMEKHLYLAEKLTTIWNDRAKIRYKKGETLQAFYYRLQRYDTMGSFLAAQVVADMKFEGLARKAPDWWTFAAPGPGSKRGLNRVCGHFVDAAWPGGSWYIHFITLYNDITPMISNTNLPRLSAQDLQNCLCEFDKYQRVLLGEGRPRSTYQGVY